MDRRIDLVGSVGVVVLGVIVLITALNYPLLSVEFDAVGPMGFPKGIAVLFIVGGLVQSLLTLRAIRATGYVGAPEGTEDDEGPSGSMTRALMMMGGSCLYLVLLRPVGFLVLTPVVMSLALYAMGYRTPWRLAAVSIGFTVIAFAVFDGVLNVPIPTGVLTGLLAQLGIIGSIR